MAIIKPFKRIKPKNELASEIAVLPVDSLDKEKISYIIEKRPYSFFRITNPELYNPEVKLCEDGKRFLNNCSKDHLETLIEENILEEDSCDLFYVYRQIIGDSELTGLVACASVDDYLNNVVKKHEHTRTEKEIDISYHINYCKANTGTIYLLYRWQEKIQNIIDECVQASPEYNFTTEDGITHLVWPLACTEVDTLIELFKGVDSFYIADGHHRTAAAARVCLDKRRENPNYTGEERFNYFLSVLFPDKDLNIIDYNRVIKDLNGLSKQEYLDKVKESFIIEEFTEDKPFKPKKPHEFGMYLENKWYKLLAKDGTFNANHPVDNLDVCILQNNILDPILGIHDPRTDKRIDFVAGVLGLETLEKRANSDMKVSFSLFPCSVKELMDVADMGEVMPPKSTWFEPKLRSGLFVHRL